MASILAKFRFSLFWKILISLWLVFVSIFILNLIIIQINTDDVRFRAVPPHHLEQLEFRKHKLKYFLNGKTRAPPRVKKILENTFLIDKQGSDYFEKDIPEMLLQLHHQVSYKHHILLAFKKESHYVGGTNIKINNKNYKIYYHQKVPLFSQGYLGLLIQEFTKKLIFITFIVSFPFSLLIAWFFNRPIRRLQTASQELTSNLQNKKLLIEMTKRSDEFGDLAKDLERFSDHLSTLIQSKNRLLGDVSHELRSPLARQKIAVALVEKSDEKDEQSIARIKLEGERLESMITSLLDYSKMDDTSSSPHLNFDLSSSLSSLLNDTKFEADSKGITLINNIEQSIKFYGVESILLSCLENLLRNAIRYASKTIEVTLLAENELINISIVDDGCGVSNDQLEKIFEAFYRPQVDRSRDSGGVGLGLSIARKAITINKGTIYAEAVHPQGLKLVVNLPYQK